MGPALRRPPIPPPLRPRSFHPRWPSQAESSRKDEETRPLTRQPRRHAPVVRWLVQELYELRCRESRILMCVYVCLCVCVTFLRRLTSAKARFVYRHWVKDRGDELEFLDEIVPGNLFLRFITWMVVRFFFLINFSKYRSAEYWRDRWLQLKKEKICQK